MNNATYEAIHDTVSESDDLFGPPASYTQYDILVWHHTKQEWSSVGLTDRKNFAQERLDRFLAEGHNAIMRVREVTVTTGDWTSYYDNKR